MSNLSKKDKILVLGNKGMVGSAIIKKLIEKNMQILLD